MTRFPLALLLAAPLALTACGGDPAAPAAPEGPAAHTASHQSPTATAPAMPRLVDGVQVVEIEAGTMGFQPRQIELQAGVPARFVITRTVDDACSSQITLPAYDVAATDLPLGEPVEIAFTPAEADEVEFVCGMDMQRGTIAVVS